MLMSAKSFYYSSFTYHPDQSWVSFSLFNCHLDHRAGTLSSQRCYGNAVGYSAALSVGQKKNECIIKRETGSNETVTSNLRCQFIYLFFTFKANQDMFFLSISVFSIKINKGIEKKAYLCLSLLQPYKG